MAETDFKYDVFLSHNSKDKPAVENIARLLRDAYSLKTWLDKWNLVPGEAWQDALEDALDDCQTVAVFLGPSGIGPWENEEMRSAISDRVQDKSRRVIPVLLPGAPDNKDLDLPRFLKRATWVDFRSGLDDKEALYRLYCGITGQAPGDQTFKPSNLKPKGSRDTWNLAHPYPMPPNFTGRATELKMLNDWLADDINRLFILRALGGFGKSALTWQWINTHVNPAEWTKLVFWSFYEGDASFEHFIEETLKYLKLEVPQSKRERVDELLKAMQAQKVLLILDGFERLLRAYSNMNASYQGDGDKKIEDADRDCVSLDTEQFLKGICSMPNMKGKALMTTRLTPRVVEKFGQFIQGCCEEELKAMNKDDAIAFFRAQGVHKGTNHEIEDTCRLYGFHPLSLRLLVGHIMTDFKNTGDIVVAQKVKVSGDIAEYQNHILEVSYNFLPSRQQKLLSIIACFRSSTKLETLESITENKETLDDDLHDLMERGLLQFDKKNTVFDLHPIVRRYAYWRFTDGARKEAHTKLAEHFIDAMPVTNKNVKTLEDLAPIIELYHHMVRSGNLDEARVLFRDRINQSTYYQFGAYQLRIELLRALFLDGEDKLPRLKDESAQGWTLNGLANSYSLGGQSHRAVTIFQNAVPLAEKIDNKKNVATALGNMADDQLKIGALREAERNLRRAIELDKELENEYGEACDRQELGRNLSHCGAWAEAEKELDTALKLFEKGNNIQSQNVTWSYHALRFLFMARDNPQFKISNLKSSSQSASRALELADEFSSSNFRVERDYILAHQLLGAAYQANGDLKQAEENLSKAISMCRQINLIELEANILLDLARLRYDQKKYEEAKNLADEALLITERCGYVLQGADVNLFLAQYALEQEKDKAKAKQYAEEALKLATCDGPPYYYKVAYEEAERFLENLK